MEPTTTAEQQQVSKMVSEYLRLQTQKAGIDAEMKLHKKSLEEYAKQNKAQFDDDGNLFFEDGYLHFGKKSIVKTMRKFSIVAFIKAFPELIKREFKVGAIKEIVKDKAGKAKLKKLGVQYDQIDLFDIVRNGEKTED
jgi:hypothetical protein